MKKLIGTMVIGEGEADRYLATTLPALQALCDDVIVLLNNVDAKTQKLVERSGVRAFKDDREWAVNQPYMKEELTKRAYELHGDWILAVDADEILCATREELEDLFLLPEVAWSVYVTQLWDDETHYRPEISFWNIRLYQSKPEMGYRFEKKPLHCGIAPAWAYHYGWYAPILLMHYGLMDVSNRKRKAERYKRHDPTGKWKPLSWYRWLSNESEGRPLNPETLVQELINKGRTPVRRDHRPRLMPINIRSYVYVTRDDGTVIDIPADHLADTLKKHPTWKTVMTAQEDTESEEAKEPPLFVKDELTCQLCGWNAKAAQGLKIHMGKFHK